MQAEAQSEVPGRARSYTTLTRSARTSKLRHTLGDGRKAGLEANAKRRSD